MWYWVGFFFFPLIGLCLYLYERRQKEKIIAACVLRLSCRLLQITASDEEKILSDILQRPFDAITHGTENGFIDEQTALIKNRAEFLGIKYYTK